MSDFFGHFGDPGAPGYVNPIAREAVAEGMGQSMAAMHNRYQQLGLGAQGATPTSPGGGGPGTAEKMDLGILPTVGGGIPGQFEAVLGQLVNSSLQYDPKSLGGKSSGIGK